MKKKSRLFRVASLLLVLCFISTVMISGTFAKYTSEYVGQDTALVAKWAVEVGVLEGSDVVDLGDENLDLFSHAYTENVLNKEGSDYIIAPGVGGEFVLSVTNNSDVAAGVEFVFTKEDGSANVPMEFSLTSDFMQKYTLNELTEALKGNELGSFANLADASDTANNNTQSTVYWRWPYEVNDELNEADTTLGKDSAAAAVDGSRTKYILEVTATATQLAPEIAPTP